jgi:hypothetical protein
MVVADAAVSVARLAISATGNAGLKNQRQGAEYGFLIRLIVD